MFKKLILFIFSTIFVANIDAQQTNVYYENINQKRVDAKSKSKAFEIIVTKANDKYTVERKEPLAKKIYEKYETSDSLGLIKEGRYIGFDFDERIALIQHYKNNLLEGYIYRYNAGKLLDSNLYKNNQLIGKGKLYSALDDIIGYYDLDDNSTGSYTFSSTAGDLKPFTIKSENGKLEGNAVLESAVSKEKSEIVYKDGKIADITYYNENGEKRKINDTADIINATYKYDMEAWKKHMERHLKYPKEARKKGIEGSVYIKFTIDRNGNISDAEAISFC